MISGFFVAAFPQPLMQVAVKIGDDDWVLVPFIVDTGAAFTSIHHGPNQTITMEKI